MMRWIFVIFAVLLPGFAVAQAVEQVAYAELQGELVELIDFENYDKVMSPGKPLDEIEVFNGARFGERFAGQILAEQDGFDVLHLKPVGPLSLSSGVPGQNLAVVFIFYMSNQLKGMAPPGFPQVEAGGEGAVSILFDRDQSALGFRVTSEPRPREAGVPKGRMNVAFYRRDGSVIDQLDVELDWSIAGYGFRRTNGSEDIAGISITNRDPAGVAIDDVIFDRYSVTSWLLP